jgi:hypothetical protein
VITFSPSPIEARVGVNTGEVVVRSIATGKDQAEYTPIGHTANLASRMQALAPTGSIALSEQTRRLVEGYFALRPLGPTRVKGVTEPVNVYEVTGLGPLRTRLQRSAGRGLTKFVGREREMEAMKHSADLAKQGRGQIVAAIADAGDRWRANLRVLDIDEIKSIPGTPRSHAFVERLIGTIRREYLDRIWFWHQRYLQRKLDDYQMFCNQYRCHTGLGGVTPAQRGGAAPPLAHLDSYRWRQHCHGLFHTPIAA